MLQPITDAIRRHRRTQRKTMNDQERTAPTHLPPPPVSPSDVAAAAPTDPPVGGTPPDELSLESDAALRSTEDRYASRELERLAVQRLLDMNARVESYMKELLDPKGSFAQSRIQMVTDLSIVVDNAMKAMRDAFVPRFEGIELKLSKQGEMIHKLEKAYEELKADTAQRFAAFEAEIRALKEDRGAGEAPAPAAG